MSPHILLVDDDIELGDLIAELLRYQGYEVSVARGAREGLACMGEHHIDLVVSDVMMPVMSGPEMVRQMKAEPLSIQAPVLFLTAMQEALVKETELLHDAVLAKPFRARELLTIVERLISARS